MDNYMIPPVELKDILNRALPVLHRINFYGLKGLYLMDVRCSFASIPGSYIFHSS